MAEIQSTARVNKNWLQEFAEFNIEIHGKDGALKIARDIYRDKKCRYPDNFGQYLKVLSAI